MKRALASAAVVAAVVAFMVVATGSGSGASNPTYRIELDNAFGLIPGADFKVAGVRAGNIKSIDLCGMVRNSGCQNPLHALVTVQVTQSGFGQFHGDAFCQSRPQSLIGEYYMQCDPGRSGPTLRNGATIPVTHTYSTIPVDFLNDVMRLPYRERFTLIINELGAAVAGRSDDLQAALRRAVPALTETDNLLNLLANDSQTLNQLNVNADTVITALANNSKLVQNFVVQANRAATASATQQHAIAGTWHQLPGFLEQLRPAMAQLGSAADANLPVFQNLNASATQLRDLFTNLPGFAHASLPALRALGQAAVPGKTAAIAARPTVHDLNNFTGPSPCVPNSVKQNCLPELAQNLRILLQDLDNRSRAVEADKRSPGGKGYTGLEALLQYVFNQALAINTYGPLGHLLTVDAFVDPLCSPYQSPQSLANNLATYGPQARRCYAWLGKNQPGINETDPSRPSACVPDPGGAPPGYHGPRTTACKLQPNPLLSAPDKPGSTSLTPTTTGSGSSGTLPAVPKPAGGGGSSFTGGLSSVLGGVLSGLGGGHLAPAQPPHGGLAGAASSSTSSAAGSGTTTNAQQLLNYLLAP
jgi:virulence factor Mce-like protein